MTDHDHDDCCEEFCCKVATRIAGPEPTVEVANEFGIGAPNWTALLELIAQIVTTLLANCPANDSLVVDAAQSPEFRERRKFNALVYRSCDSCVSYRWRDKSGEIAAAMREEAKAASKEELLAIVFQARNDDWLAV